MEYRHNEFTKYYEKYLAKFDQDRNVPPDNRHKELLLIRTNFTMEHQAQIITEGNGVYYTNMWQIVFGELRVYLKIHQKSVYSKVDWARSAEELIEDLIQ
mgnify:CR=1 FL=1